LDLHQTSTIKGISRMNSIDKLIEGLISLRSLDPDPIITYHGQGCLIVHSSDLIEKGMTETQKTRMLELGWVREPYYCYEPSKWVWECGMQLLD